MLFFFFFQAEDGIRDDLVTGVKTCALPIFTCSEADYCERNSIFLNMIRRFGARDRKIPSASTEEYSPLSAIPRTLCLLAISFKQAVLFVGHRSLQKGEDDRASERTRQPKRRKSGRIL